MCFSNGLKKAGNGLSSMKRKFLVLAAGIIFLVAISWIGGILSNAAPRTPTAHVQTSQAGPYHITLQIDPNPPQLTQPATVSLQLANSSQQAVTDVQVFIDSSMMTMDMGTARDEARSQGNGVYRAQVQFAMSGPWALRVVINRTGQKAVSTTFQVTAQ